LEEAVLNGLDLFSGIGGISLALRPWVRTIAYCENDRHAQAILLSRMWAGDLDHAPISDDVCSLRGQPVSAIPIDIISGGFPCQDISVAGRGDGLAGERSGLVFEVFRLVREIQPSFIFLENVPAIRTRGADVVVGELARLGYDCRWLVISAEEVGAPHLRKRWFLLAAHAKRLKLRDEQGWSRGPKRKDETEPEPDGEDREMADATSDGRIKRRTEPERIAGRPGAALNSFKNGPSWWATEPDVGRVAHGVPFRVDRLRGLGNAVVPAQAREAFKRLIGAHT